MQEMTPGTKSKLDHTIRMLAAEFPHLHHEVVRREVETVTGALLASARFDDYIPILAHRSARDRLSSLGATPAGVAGRGLAARIGRSVSRGSRNQPAGERRPGTAIRGR